MKSLSIMKRLFISVIALLVFNIFITDNATANEEKDTYKKTRSVPFCKNIKSVPYTIKRPGIYCLVKNLHYNKSTGSAVTIEVDTVVIDMNGLTLSGSTEPDTVATGISAPDRENITIKNGTVQGFWIGIGMSGDGHLIEGIRGVSSTWNSILINSGESNIIRNNHVLSTGGTSAYGVDNAFGIAVFGSGTTVINNDVFDTENPGETYGIWLGGDHFAINNRVFSAQFGIFYNYGNGKYRDNLTLNVDTPYTGGIDAGNNN